MALAIPLIHVWDGGQETLSGHTDKVTAAKFKLTRHQAVTGSRDRTVKEWDLGRAYCEAPPCPLPHPPGPPRPGHEGPQPALEVAPRVTAVRDETSHGLSSVPHQRCFPWLLGELRLWAGRQGIWFRVWEDTIPLGFWTGLAPDDPSLRWGLCSLVPRLQDHQCRVLL